MSKAVWKYEVEAKDTPTVHDFPMGAKIVHVGPSKHPEWVNLWVEVSPGNPYDRRSFMVFGTGHTIGPDAQYLGTVVWPDPWLVWHVYEVT